MEPVSNFTSFDTPAPHSDRKPLLSEPREKSSTPGNSNLAGIFARFVVDANGDIVPAERVVVGCAG